MRSEEGETEGGIDGWMSTDGSSLFGTNNSPGFG